MRLTHLHSGIFTKRRLIMWGSAILVVLTVAGYSVWSQHMWQQFTPAYSHWHQQVKTDTDQAAALPVGTSEEKSRALAAFMAIATHIDATSSTICTTHPLVQWQTAIIAPLKKELVACQSNVTQTLGFKEQLQKAVIYLQNDQALANLIAAIPQSDQLDDKAWGAQVTAWTAASNLIKAMKVSESFKPVQAQAAEYVANVATAWQEVIAASQAKDKKRYLAAQDALAAAHDDLNEITITNSKATKQLTEQLQAAYVKSFTQKL